MLLSFGLHLGNFTFLEGSRLINLEVGFVSISLVISQFLVKMHIPCSLGWGIENQANYVTHSLEDKTPSKTNL